MKTIYISDHIALNESWNDVSHKSCTGNQNTHILRSLTYFSKIVPFMRDYGGKKSGAGKAKDDNMAHAHCTLDN